MSGIAVTIDTRDFNRAIDEILKSKMKKIQDSSELRKEAEDLLLDYIRDYLPEDTGALRYQKSGTASKPPHYFREGHIERFTDSIRWDAIERRLHDDRHYAGILFTNIFGGPDMESIVNTLNETGDWESFLRECAELINSFLRDA